MKLGMWVMVRYCSPQIRSDRIIYFRTEENKLKSLTFSQIRYLKCTFACPILVSTLLCLTLENELATEHAKKRNIFVLCCFCFLLYGPEDE